MYIRLRPMLVALLLLSFSVSAWSSGTGPQPQAPNGGAAPGAVCTNCGDGPGGGGGGGGGGNNPPNVKLSLFTLDPAAGTLTYQLSNGATMVIDGRLDEVHLSTARGDWDFSLSAVLDKWSNGNAMKAAAELQRIHELLSSSDNVGAIMSTSSVNLRAGASGPVANVINVPGTNLPDCSSPFVVCAVASDLIVDWGFYDFIFNADYWRDPFTRDTGIDPPAPGGGPGGPMQRDGHYWAWYYWRKNHCDAIPHDKLLVGAAAAATTGACVLAETGAGALACAALFAELGDRLITLDQDKAICASRYDPDE